MNIFDINFIIIWLFILYGILIPKNSSPLLVFIIGFVLDIVFHCRLGTCCALSISNMMFNTSKNYKLTIIFFSLFLYFNNLLSLYLLGICSLKLIFVKYL